MNVKLNTNRVIEYKIYKKQMSVSSIPGIIFVLTLIFFTVLACLLALST